MDGINVLLTMCFLLIITLIGLVRAQTMLGVFVSFVILTLVAHMTLYMFNAE